MKEESGWRRLASVWEGFWFEARLSTWRLAAFRFAFYGLLGLDALMLMLPHASRYGAGGFNVSHLPWLDRWLPTPTVGAVTVMLLLIGLLSWQVALGLGARRSAVAVFGLYAATYLWSQADSYQHHYLIALLLCLGCFLPFDAMPSVERPRGGWASTTTSWATALIYVQVAVVYLYTGIAKTDTRWRDGWALMQIVSGGEVRDLLQWAADVAQVQVQSVFAVVAWSIMAFQFFVALAFVVPRLRPVAFVVGPWFHLAVELLNLKIGWFSWYMIVIYYLLLMPERWFGAVVGWAGRLLSPAVDRLRSLTQGDGLELGTRLVVGGGAALVSGFMAWCMPVEGSGWLAVWVMALPVLAVAWPQRRRESSALVLGVLHVVLVLVQYGVVVGGDVGYDYHRLWAGDLRRRGELEAAVEHYELANRLRGDGVEEARFYELATLYEELGRWSEARLAYEEALRRRPGDVRVVQGLERVRVRLEQAP